MYINDNNSIREFSYWALAPHARSRLNAIDEARIGLSLIVHLIVLQRMLLISHIQASEITGQ